MTDPYASLCPILEITLADPADLETLLTTMTTPFVVRNLVSTWPLVQAAKRSNQAARDYLLGFRRDVMFTYALAPCGHGGRMFYDSQMNMNFQNARAKLSDIFARMAEQEGQEAPALTYLAGLDLNDYFKGLDHDNPMPMRVGSCLKSLWIGSATRVAAHNDFPDNLACVAAGQRRFTLFPPDQFSNLYLGPIDNTPGGRPISMVDFHDPDFDTYPRYQTALSKAQTALLGPGDAIFIPSLWWHQVEGLSDFNLLINYWWRQTPRFLGQPQNALNLALLSIRDLPPHEKQHWQELFSHYVFNPTSAVTDHIPKDHRGVLDPLTPDTAARLHGYVLRQLNR